MQGPGTAVFLNGLPGSGKSTLARQLVDARAGWFLLDVDDLRTSVGGWADDFAGAGRTVRPVARSIVRTVVAGGGTVVVPQLFDDADELTAFADEARRAGGRAIHVLLDVPEDECRRRLARRRRVAGEGRGPSLARVVGEALDRAGGAEHLEVLAERLRHVVRGPLAACPVDGRDGGRALVELVEVLDLMAR
ncbi:AAA family ATPase [Clavibacter sp. Sh2036]|uniref:AAA family ATPase n=1 Tax=Clavibacter sp. Sh2036 TaxID=3397677 RepID=UPI0039E1DA3F